MAEWTDEVFTPHVIIVSVFGHCGSMSENALYESILFPLLEEWQRMPDHLLLPIEGKTSIYLHQWAETMKIPTQLFHADWKRNGRMAQILREERMIQECTHAIVFLSNRSQRLEKFAERWARKGKQVFTWNGELTHLIPAPVEAPVRKSDTGTMQKWLKYQTKESH